MAHADRLLRPAGTALVAVLALLAPGVADAHAAVRVLRPSADTQVGGQRHARGHAGTLVAGARPARRVLIRFDAKRLRGAVTHAELRVRAAARRWSELDVHVLRHAGRWSERRATLAAAPVRGALIAHSTVRHRRWVVLDVTRAVRRGTLDFVLTSPSRAGIAVRSRESRNAPRLVVTLRSGTPGSSPGGGSPGAPSGGPATVVLNPEPVLPPASIFVAPTGSDSAPCTQSAPCATLDRAYHAAAGGQVVEVAGGDYPDQAMSGDPSKAGGGPVWLRPAPGAVASLQSLSMEGPSNVGFLGLRVKDDITVVNSDPTIPGSHDVTLQNLRAQTFKIIGRVSNIAVRGGVYGNTIDWQPQISKYNRGDPESSRPSGILINGVTFQHFNRSAPDVHTECLQVLTVDGLTVSNSRFNDCDGTGDIGITDGPSDNLTFENNFLGKAGDAFYAMQITRNVHNLVLRNNSASKASVFSDSETGGPYTFVGNYMPFSSGLCDPNGTYSHNVWAGGTCGPTDVDVPSMRFVDEDAFNLHLAANSQAINRGDPKSYPATDIDGETRPLGGAPDAGADELR